MLRFALALLLGAFASIAAPASAQDGARAPKGPALWKIADQDSEIWLFGSVHMLDPASEWRRPALAQALDAADVVYFEAPTDLIAQAKVQSVLIEIGFNPAGTVLTDFLDDEADAELEHAAEEISLPLQALQAMRPWLAMMTLTAKQAEMAGGDPNYGVEVQLGLDARKARKEVRTFETLEQQTRFFADMSLETQIALLEQTLEHFDDTSEQLQAMVSAWRNGDLKSLETLVFSAAEETPPEFFEVIFARRNADWAAEIEALMEGEGRVLIVVGAGHLLGPGSVLELLKEKGYVAERL